MIKYQNSVASTIDGTPIIGAQVLVTVFGQPGTQAAVYADPNGTTQLTQPLLTNQQGSFAFYASDGRYTVTVSAAETTISQADITIVDSLAIKDRALLAPENDAGSLIPPLAERAGKLLMFNEDGTATAALPNSFPGDPGPALATFFTLATFKAAPTSNATQVLQAGGIPAGTFIWTPGNYTGQSDDVNIIKADSTALSVGAWVRQRADGITFTQSGAGAVTEDIQTAVRRFKWAEQRGLRGVTMTDFDAMSSAQKTALAAANSAAILAAVVALRTNPQALSTDGLGGGSFTAYASGELLIGEGVFPIAPGTLRFTQDLGLIIKGRGSRKTNNAVRGRTVLLLIGNGDYGIQFYGNGARGAVIEDLDLCYEGNAFAGDVLDNFGSPGMVVNRCHIGTNGISGGTRFTTARSLLRSTYGEFIHCIDTTFNGAVDGAWFDDQRQSSVGPANEFGGSGMLFTSCVWYDVTGAMVRADGNRNLKKLAVRDCAFNPIAVDCTHALKLNNVDALAIDGCLFSPSVSNIPAGGWLNIVNCTGAIRSNEFLGNCDLTAATGIDGHLSIDNNFVDANQGFLLRGGIFTGVGNEFSRCASGWKTVTTPNRALTVRVGPDLFKADVGYSYDVAADNALLDGRIDYSDAQDSSVNRFRNVSGRVAIRNGSEKRITISSTPYAVLTTNTGYRIELSAANAVANLPAASNGGLRFTFFTNNTNVFTINAPSGTLLAGGGGPKTSVTTAGDAGAMVTVESFAGVWNITGTRGGVTFA